MKKRILALALAGTTAFSVFGAAMSANAAAPTGTPNASAHTVSSNDVYKHYSPVAKAIENVYNVAEAEKSVIDYYVDTKLDVVVGKSDNKEITTSELNRHLNSEEVKKELQSGYKGYYPIEIEGSYVGYYKVEIEQTNPIQSDYASYIKYYNPSNSKTVYYVDENGKVYGSNGRASTTTEDDLKAQIGTLNVVTIYARKSGANLVVSDTKTAEELEEVPTEKEKVTYFVSEDNSAILTVVDKEVMGIDPTSPDAVKAIKAAKGTDIKYYLNGDVTKEGIETAETTAQYYLSEDEKTVLDVDGKKVTGDVAKAVKAAKSAKAKLTYYYSGDVVDGATLTAGKWSNLKYADADAYVEANLTAYYTTIDGKPASGSIKLLYDDIDDNLYSLSNWTFNASTSADTEIYPWTVGTGYTVDADGVKVVVNEAVSAPTLYLLDFLPYNSVVASSSTIANAYNAYVSAANKYEAAAYAYEKDATDANKKAMDDAEKAMNEAEAKAAALIGNDWKAETGYGGSYGIRADVVEEYEEFLSELILLKKGYYVDGGYTVSKPEFKDEYADQFVSGYYYDKYTGLATSNKWTSDLYNLSDLLDDIYNSSLPSSTGYAYNYLNMNTSELMYLMQQYDKYIGNYIEKAEVEKDAWGDLLVSILENVAEDDFKKAADYKTFARKAEDAIDAYEDAETSSMIKTAEQAMYNLIVSEQSKTAGAADEKKALKSDLVGLYFNVKTLPAAYETAYATPGTNAALTNYAYIAAVTTVSDSVYVNSTTIDRIGTTTTGHYSLYPMADYIDDDVTTPNEAYVGNAMTDAFKGYATEEYEWFWNVYQLAAKVNGTTKAVAGVVTAVNDALNEAVADLEVTKAATATAESALDEMIEHHAEVLDFYVTGNGVNEEDFSDTYYAAYEEALAYAEVAEGAYQVANARYMVNVAAKALTYQGAQVTVTKNDIKTLTTAITDGKTALKAIKDSKDYNAAQVTALNKAIDQAQDVVDIYNAKYSSSYNKVNYASIASIGDKDGIVKSDITGAIDAINAAIDYSEIVMGWSKNEAGKWMYGTEDGYLSNGWNKIGSVWYYFNEDGTAKQSEWMQLDGNWYWFNSNAGAAIGWAKVDGQWYYFGGNNAMKTGWQKVDGSWYYLASSGRMVTGWVQVGGKWYYMSKESNSLGQMLSNTTVEGYKLGADGAMIEK